MMITASVCSPKKKDTATATTSRISSALRTGARVPTRGAHGGRARRRAAGAEPHSRLLGGEALSAAPEVRQHCIRRPGGGVRDCQPGRGRPQGAVLRAYAGHSLQELGRMQQYGDRGDGPEPSRTALVTSPDAHGGTPCHGTWLLTPTTHATRQAQSVTQLTMAWPKADAYSGSCTGRQRVANRTAGASRAAGLWPVGDDTGRDDERFRGGLATRDIASSGREPLAVGTFGPAVVGTPARRCCHAPRRKPRHAPRGETMKGCAAAAALLLLVVLLVVALYAYTSTAPF